MSIKRERLIPLIFFFVIFVSSILVHILGFAGLDSNLETAFGSDGSSSTTSTTTTMTITSFTLKDRVSGDITYTKSRTISWDATVDGPYTNYQVSQESSNGTWLSMAFSGQYTLYTSGDGSKSVTYFAKRPDLTVDSRSNTITLDTVAPTVIVTQPITGESLAAGLTNYTIKRTTSDGTSGIKANSLNWRYSTDGGANWNVIALGQPDQNYTTWTVPNVNSTTCMISLEAQDGAGNVGVGNSGLFTIEPLSITVRTPNDHEVFKNGSASNITWEAGGAPDTYNLYYSTNGGSSYTSIISGTTEADKSYPWTPAGVTPSTNCKIRIEAIRASLRATDESDATFKIADSNVFTVTTTADSGAGSLRYCLDSAEASSDINLIDFYLPTSEAIPIPGVAGKYYWSIRPGSLVHTSITNPVYINATTQPTTDAYSNPSGPVVELKPTVSVNGFVLDSASYTTIEGFVINNCATAISLVGGSNKRIVGNFLGVTPSGEAASANNYDLSLDATSNNNIIGGITAAERNIISGATYDNLTIAGSYNTIEGNYIGLTASGEGTIYQAADTMTANGINVTGNNNFIGGGNAGEGNFVAIGENLFGAQAGINIPSNNNIVKGNYIGTDKTGTVKLGNNSLGGIYLTGTAANNQIGGANAGDRNIISGNKYGVYLYTTSDGVKNNIIKGNYIGLNASGTAAIANTTGIYFYGDSSSGLVQSNTIEANVISGNTNYGVELMGGSTVMAMPGGIANNNYVYNNYIGTDKNGTTSISNGTGIFLYGSATNNNIGGATGSQRNIISGNTNCGLQFLSFTNMGTIHETKNNLIKGNYVGTAQNGTDSLPNGRGISLEGVSGDNCYLNTFEANTIANNNSEGIYFGDYSQNNFIGPNNIIKSNVTSGVKVNGANAYGNLITQNTFEANTGKGVSLTSGANNGIAVPVITSAAKYGSTITISGTSGSGATIEVFRASSEATSTDEGWVFLGSTIATGTSWSKDVTGLNIGDLVVATQTDTSNNTSEFALYSTVVTGDATGPTIEVTAPTSSTKWKGGSTQNITFTVTDESGIKPNSLDIYYSTDGVPTYSNLITSDAVVSSPFAWIVPSINSNQVKVRVRAKDNSTNYNYGTGESTGNCTIDSTGPVMGNLVTPANGALTSNTTPLLTWEAATDALTAVASYEIRIDTTNVTTQGAVTTFTPSVALSDGLHTWEVRAKDEVGNWGSYSSSFTFEVNSSVPTVGSITLKDTTRGSNTYTGNQIVTLEATGVGGSPTQLISSESATFVGASWVDYVNPTRFNLSAGDGTKRVYYKIRNVVLTESATRDATIILDTTTPVATLEKPNGGETLTGGGTYTITWEATDAIGFKTNPITLRYSQDSGATWTQIATSLANTGTYSWSVPVINKTTCRVSVEAEDNVGLIGTDLSNADFTITSGGPAASTLLTPANNSYTSSLSPTFSWTSSVDAVAYEVTIGTSVTTQTATSYTPTLMQGAYTWKVRSKNLTGTWGSDSATWTVTVDATAPTVAFNPLISDISPIVLRTMAATTNTTNPKPTLTGTATDNFAVSSVEVRLDGGSWVSGEITSGTGTTSAPFKYVYTGALLTQGTHTIEGRAYDLAGNVTSPLGLMEFNVTPAERTVTVTSARATVVNNGLVTVRPTFTVAINSASYPISALTVKWGQDTTSDIPYTLKTIASEFTETSFDVAPIADLIANTAYKLTITGTDTRGDFDASITGLKYETKPEVKVPVTTVTPGQPGEPALVNLEFQSSGLGDADLYIYDSSNIQVKHVKIPSINVGKNDLSLSLLSDAGVTLGRGIYRYFLKYGNDAPIEGAFFVQ